MKQVIVPIPGTARGLQIFFESPPVEAAIDHAVELAKTTAEIAVPLAEAMVDRVAQPAERLIERAIFRLMVWRGEPDAVELDRIRRAVEGMQR